MLRPLPSAICQLLGVTPESGLKEWVLSGRTMRVVAVLALLVLQWGLSNWDPCLRSGVLALISLTALVVFRKQVRGVWRSPLTRGASAKPAAAVRAIKRGLHHERHIQSFSLLQIIHSPANLKLNFTRWHIQTIPANWRWRSSLSYAWSSPGSLSFYDVMSGDGFRGLSGLMTGWCYYLWYIPSIPYWYQC
jgi:hypothetical protein